MSWTLRLLLEKTEHTSTDFVTLTYRSVTETERLDYTHFEKFIKQLRRSTGKRVRYFCCGEYGGKTSRPHWHVMLYGHRLPARGLQVIEPWPHGHVFTGEIEPGSAQYVCRYVLKSAMKSDLEQIIRMSRRPGIGLSTIRKIGLKLSKMVPEMEYMNPVLVWDKKSYWLDRHAYDALVNSYVGGGGYLTYEHAPNNDALDDLSIRGLPVDSVVRSWMRQTRGKI